MMKARLVPMVFEFTSHRGDRVSTCEKVLLIVEDYPETLIHIDSIVKGELATRLISGEELNVEITVEEVENE